MTAVAPAAAKVFISYRRVGTAMHAGRLYDAMTARFGDHNVFMDLEMAPGEDFVERIKTEVGRCRALLVVIGPEWMGANDGTASGAQRLADPGDFVRLEVETALQAADVTIIPVLVAGAHMPDPDALPETLRPLARRNAIELTDLRWRYDCQRLMTALDDLLGGGDGDCGPRTGTGTGTGVDVSALLPLWLEGVAVAVAAGLIARLAFDFLSVPNGSPERDTVIAAIELRGVCWAAIGAALAVWLTLRRGDHGRLLQRTALGLLLGALAGALGGALWGLASYLPHDNAGPEARNQIQIAALALTGGIVGMALGMLWIPRRAAVGCLGGALGGAAVQLATNATAHPQDPWALGLNCFAIVGVALLGMLVLDVRAAAATRRAALAPDVARA